MSGRYSGTQRTEARPLGKAGLPGWSPEALAFLPGLRSFPPLPEARRGSGRWGRLLSLLGQSPSRSPKVEHVFPLQPVPASSSGPSRRGLGSRLSCWPSCPQRPTHPRGMNELRRAGTWPHSRPIFRALPGLAAARTGKDPRRGWCGDLLGVPGEPTREGGAPTRGVRLSVLGGRWRRALSGGSESTPGAPVRAGGGERRGGGGGAAVASMCYAAQ